ncbi:Leucyl-tRNA synthetase, partial [mine drainage metagenome]
VGADALRLFHLFVGPPADDVDWNEQTESLIDGCARFLDRLYRLATLEDVRWREAEDERDREVRRAVHRCVARVSESIERWSYNTAVAALMETLNTVSKWARDEAGAHRATYDEAIDLLLRLLAPMAPHLSAELWERRHPGEPSVHAQPWPVADPALVATPQ